MMKKSNRCFSKNKISKINSNKEFKMEKLLSSKLAPLIVTLPCTVIGAISMFINKVPILIWGQNIICLMIAGIISYLILSKAKVKETKYNSITIIITVIFLLLTFVGPGFQGVSRWISIGPFNFYVASIVIPILIIELNKLSQFSNWFILVLIILFISILLTLQPDASQSTAFIIPMIILLWRKTNKNVLRISITALLSILIVYAWVFLDSLPPVAYVEKIISLVSNMGIFWFIIGIISFIILPVPFILFPPKGFKLLSTCIGVYFIIILISTQLGNFPVPLMGYGISPIIGYFISISWFVKAKINF